ncbi:MAG TPA: cytochrome c [Nitrospiria bacterium]|nr:cytochrome c [Nitrospiria bacterium]
MRVFLKASGFMVLLFFAMGAFSAYSQTTLKTPALDKIPAEYKDKKMPAGFWSDPKIIKEGKDIYEGSVNAMVNCAACHGMDGKPMLPIARDLRDAGYMGKMTEAYWFWRISEGVDNTQMQGFKRALKEEQIWKLMSYENTFSKSHK